MPYVKQEDRTRMWNELSSPNPETPGELNYVLSVFIDRYMQRKGKNYQTINDIVGALEGAKLEFYRRIAAPYEDQKIIENGDVY